VNMADPLAFGVIDHDPSHRTRGIGAWQPG
jgi:hypothetical protein